MGRWLGLTLALSAHQRCSPRSRPAPARASVSQSSRTALTQWRPLHGPPKGKRADSRAPTAGTRLPAGFELEPGPAQPTAETTEFEKSIDT